MPADKNFENQLLLDLDAIPQEKIWSIFSWTPNQKQMIINMLVHSLPCNDHEQETQIWVFMKLRAMKISPTIR